MEISRVVFYCDDRKVGQILRLLAGIALQTPEVTPVVNAQQKNGKLEQKTEGKASEVFAEHLKKQGLKTFHTSALRAFLPTIGRSEKSVNTVLHHMIKYDKLAKKVEGRGNYALTGGKK